MNHKVPLYHPHIVKVNDYHCPTLPVTLRFPVRKSQGNPREIFNCFPSRESYHAVFLFFVGKLMGNPLGNFSIPNGNLLAVCFSCRCFVVNFPELETLSCLLLMHSFPCKGNQQMISLHRKSATSRILALFLV